MSPADSAAVITLGSLLLYALLGAGVCGVAGYLMLDRVDRGFTGRLLGFFLGLIGLVIAWVLRDNGIRDEEDRRRRHEPPLRPRADPTHPSWRIAQHRTPAPAAPLPPPSDRASQLAAQLTSEVDALERLAKLRDAGHLTPEEFEAKKRQILASGAAPRTTVWLAAAQVPMIPHWHRVERIAERLSITTP